MPKAAAISKNVREEWFDQHLNGVLTWEDMMARAHEAAPGKITDKMVKIWLNAYKREVARAEQAEAAADAAPQDAPPGASPRRGVVFTDQAWAGIVADMRNMQKMLSDLLDRLGD